jgi:hypothetical protein
LAENIFKELLVPAGPENATAAHHAKATTLRLVLCELLERAARIHPPQPLTCACGEADQISKPIPVPDRRPASSCWAVSRR